MTPNSWVKWDRNLFTEANIDMKQKTEERRSWGTRTMVCEDTIEVKTLEHKPLEELSNVWEFFSRIKHII